MTTVKVSMSGLNRVMSCGLSAVLPHVKRSYPSAWRDFGTAAHAFLARVPEVGRDAALAEADEEFREALEAIDLSKTPACQPGSRAFEVSFIWNWADGTALEIGRNLERSYPELGPTEIPGTADAVGIDGDTVIVEDFKTGFGDLSPVEDDLQLAGYAIAATLAYGKSRARVSFIRIRDGNPKHESAELDEIDLSIRAAAIKARMKEISARGLEQEPHEGPWCKWCPAYDACPAKQQLARALAAPVDTMLGAITAANGARVLSALKASREVLDRIEARLKELAEVDPIPLAGGKVYGQYTRSLGPALDAEKARATLVARYGPAGESAWDAAVVRKTELKKGALESALKPVVEAAGRPFAREMRALFEAFEADGASRERVAKCIGEHKPK
jgi:RecB family exonuclease